MEEGLKVVLAAKAATIGECGESLITLLGTIELIGALKALSCLPCPGGVVYVARSTILLEDRTPMSKAHLTAYLPHSSEHVG